MKKQLLLTLLLAMIANVSFASFFNGNWRWRNNDGNETTATWRELQSTAIEVTSTSEILRLRIEVASNTDASKGEAVVQWSPDGTAWTTLNTPATNSVNNPFAIAEANSFLTKDEPTTQQISPSAWSAPSYTFVPGSVIYDRGNIVMGLNATFNRLLEYEIVLIPTTKLEAGKTYYFRVHNSDYAKGTLTHPTVTTPVTLPITLKSLIIKTSLEGNRIVWSTVSEVNNKYFKLERSANGMKWESIATIDGNGTTNNQSNYSFLDSNPLNGVNYYRLAQYDKDGKINYSGITYAKFDIRSWEPTVYPNPFVNQLNVSLMGYNGKTFEARLTDTQGQTVFQSQSVANENGINIQLNQVPKAGVYILNITGNGLNFIKKVTLK